MKGGSEISFPSFGEKAEVVSVLRVQQGVGQGTGGYLSLMWEELKDNGKQDAFGQMHGLQ